MTALLSPASLATIVALIILLPVAIGFGVSRMAARRVRDDDRQRAKRLAALMRGYLRGQYPPGLLATEVHAADEATFWSAIEGRLATLPRGARRRLARALERNPHSAEERRVLLDDSPLRRELAARRLGLLPTFASRRALRAALAADQGIGAIASAHALARISDLPTLEWLFENPAHLRGRPAAEWTELFRAFGRRALTRIAEALARGLDDPRMICGAVEALGLGGYGAAAPVIERLLTHTEVDVRVVSARALGRLAAEPCSDALMHALRDPAWQVRAQAARALGRIGRDTAAGMLALSLTDREWWVRHHAAHALARLGDRGTGLLREAAANSPDRYARDIAEDALESLAQSA